MAMVVKVLNFRGIGRGSIFNHRSLRGHPACRKEKWMMGSGVREASVLHLHSVLGLAGYSAGNRFK
jgi:hypothetical protein